MCVCVCVCVCVCGLKLALGVQRHCPENVYARDGLRYLAKVGEGGCR